MMPYSEREGFLFGLTPTPATIFATPESELTSRAPGCYQFCSADEDG